MSDTLDIDSVDIARYVEKALDPEAALKELGFANRGTSEDGTKTFWTRKIGRGYWHSVVFNNATGVPFYRKLKISGRGIGQEHTVLDLKSDATMNDIRRKVLKWKHEDAQEVIVRLLDSTPDNPDALDPRADLERLMPHKCPECGSSNISNEADEEGLLDCFNCGIWFNPLHAANAPNVPGNYPDPSTVEIIDRPIREALEDEISDLKAYALQHGLPPRVTITFSRTTPESVADGEYSEIGYHNEEGVEMTLDEYDIEDGLTLADITAKYLKNEGALEPSSSQFHPGVWYSTGWNTLSYRTGEEEERNYHLVGFNAEQEKAVWDKLHERQR